MSRYTVYSTPVLHDGERYEIGDEIELADAQARPLLEDGTVIPKGRRARSAPGAGEGDGGDDGAK